MRLIEQLLEFIYGPPDTGWMQWPVLTCSRCWRDVRLKKTVPKYKFRWYLYYEDEAWKEHRQRLCPAVRTLLDDLADLTD